MPLRPQAGFLPDLSAIPPEIARHAKILWLNYPNNPTAAVAPREFFQQVIEFARRQHILVCHDAAYAQVAFDGYRAPSLLEIPGAQEAAVEFNTLSKSHNMAGWRVGAALGNTAALGALHTIKTHADSGHFLPLMEAAVAAMNGDQNWLEARNAMYQERRDVMVTALREMGFDPQEPRASLYVWLPLPRGRAALEFAAALLESAHVSLTPGTVFGPGGEGFVRLSLTQPVALIAEAMERMRGVSR